MNNKLVDEIVKNSTDEINKISNEQLKIMSDKENEIVKATNVLNTANTQLEENNLRSEKLNNDYERLKEELDNKAYHQLTEQEKTVKKNLEAHENFTNLMNTMTFLKSSMNNVNTSNEYIKDLLENVNKRLENVEETNEMITKLYDKTKEFEIRQKNTETLVKEIIDNQHLQAEFLEEQSKKKKSFFNFWS